MQVTVRNGDSFWYYSQLFSIRLPLILDSNPNAADRYLYIGETINIPGYVAEDYTIQSGDSFWSIAYSRNIPLDSVFLLNPMVNPNFLQVGQTIRVPLRVTWRIVNGKNNYTYESMVTDINRLVMVYPFIFQRSIGESVMGKSIPEIKVGRGNETVHVDGSFHANEWITTSIIMTFLNDYLLSLTNQTSIRGLDMLPYYNSKMLSVVPMVNPDGVNLVINGPPNEEPFQSNVFEINNGSTNFNGWKANINGVDLNNQFPAKWEIEKERKEQAPAPANYPGPEPLSEPESKAMAQLTRNSNFFRALAFHTQGEVIYWGFEGLEPPEAETIVQEFARVSGYTPIQYVDSYAGYKDWFIQEWRRPGYTVELGEGVSPLPLTQFDEIYQESLGIFLANLYL
ncbi:M14 family metallopeptidase [Pontibacillus sp. HMF3514]|uniref:M14 family metallopeptidase n=1 Tax=Pontibacillus sp. HMF3514 TaxID=2692425 RepID=UPI00131F59F6|nr:M14 family metallopeptidase [Pontibacillus sp. HMF3514]QHE54283.1 LysM peptidoglycan-binding domain-containing protein [Pontibacillus sp. HMF3514]